MKLSFIVLFLIVSTEAFANKELPLWEFGVGAFPLRTDHYRGSPQNKWYTFPLLAYVYRGEKVEAESGYIRGHILKSGNLLLDWSFALGLNTNSEENNLRKGMRDLDPTFEVGPALRYYLWKSQDGDHFINLEMPYRAVYSSNLKYLEHVGYYSIPYINYLSKPATHTLGFAVEASVGIQYGSQGFHNRFYAVSSKDVNPTRSYFHSVAGYSGTQFSVLLSKRINDFLIMPFLRYDYLDKAVYTDSPIYKNPNFVMFGMAFIWYFSHSDKKQKAPTMVK